jgi:hypothetical protein
MAVVRSKGSTPSEQYLARLCERSFLSLWSYPNVYRDQGKRDTGSGKEVCDLLVACGEDVVIFSVKQIGFPSTLDSRLAWARWCRRAVLHSARQLRGAERWLDHPRRLFLEPSCTQTLPIELPPRENRSVHRVVVALGAGQASREYFGSGTGSLMIIPAVKAGQHVEIESPEFAPFAIGDVDPRGDFVHVLDDATLELLLSELDTIRDFVRYLRQKECFVRSGHLASAAGEEELLGYYLAHIDSSKEHAFIPPSGRDNWEPNEYCVLSEGIWERTRTRPEFLAKKEADRQSYFWDQLIEKFADSLLDGDASLPAGGEESVQVCERALRYMAYETRFERRVIARHLLDAIDMALPGQMYAKIIGLQEPPRDRTVYVFLQFPFNQADGAPDYKEYRRRRRITLYAYAMGLKSEYPGISRVIAIGTEPPKFSQGLSTSEDLLMVEVEEWTSEHQSEVEYLRDLFQIFSPKTLTKEWVQSREYPEPDAQE